MSPGVRTKSNITRLAPLVFILCCLWAVASAAPICEKCRSKISGRYVTVGQKRFHPQHFTCQRCDTPIGGARFFEKDGKFYDDTCHTILFVPDCDYCGAKLHDSYTVSGGKNYHDACFANHIALRCDLCHYIIEGKYSESFWGDRYHAAHLDTYPVCRYCGRLVGAELSNFGRREANGAHVCDICERTSITNEKRGRQIMTEVVATLQSAGIHVEFKPELKLISRDKMKHKAGARSQDMLGYTDYQETSSAFGLFTSRTMTIYLLDGLPEALYRSTIAHELMHVWQNSNAPLDMDDAWREGSCNYASLLELQTLISDEAKFLIENMYRDPDPSYGEGFRKVAAYVNRVGVSAWLERMAAGDPPPW